jgi:hypothetical protein
VHKETNLALLYVKKRIWKFAKYIQDAESQFHHLIGAL